jgi:hypothetical protein
VEEALAMCPPSIAAPLAKTTAAMSLSDAKSREPASFITAAGPGWDEPAFMGGAAVRHWLARAGLQQPTENVFEEKRLPESLNLSFISA